MVCPESCESSRVGVGLGRVGQAAWFDLRLREALAAMLGTTLPACFPCHACLPVWLPPPATNPVSPQLHRQPTARTGKHWLARLPLPKACQACHQAGCLIAPADLRHYWVLTPLARLKTARVRSLVANRNYRKRVTWSSILRLLSEKTVCFLPSMCEMKGGNRQSRAL